jgi:iron complex outermembrane receptor protein
LALFFEYFFEYHKLGITTGIMVSRNSAFPSAPFFFPGIDVSLRVSQNISLFTSVNRALHLPTFTDLFYTDPQHAGNQILSPNTITSFEGGVKYRNSLTLFRCVLFLNKGKNITDWLWSYQSKKFSPVNLEKFQSTGISITLQLETPEASALSVVLGKIQLNYIYLNVKKSISDSVSKYYNLKHKFSILLSQQIFKNVSLGWKFSYQDRYGEAMTFDDYSKEYLSVPYSPFWLLDVNARWSLRKIMIFADVKNVLNKKYMDAGSAIQEGRNLKAGFAINFNFRNEK